MNTEKGEILIVKLLDNRISETESEALTQWIEEEDHLDYFNKYVEIHYLINSQQSFDYQKSLDRVKHLLKEVKRKKRMTSLLKYAAVLLVLVGIGYFMTTKTIVSKQGPAAVVNTIKPGSLKATLTLSDGTEVTLEKEQTYASNDLQSIGEKLIYTQASKAGKPKTTYNSLSIPRGGQFFVKLEDGTQVWLNSESKLRYPVNFTDGEIREVELVYGEAYFEVSPSTEHNGDTFKVISGEQEVEVLGTQFNIKAYKDEVKTYTTLVEGKIALVTQDNNKILKPGQQAILNPASKKVEINRVDVFNQISWKDGVFSFKNKPLKEIMKAMSRWYDIEVIFSNPEVKNTRFTGVLGKEQSLENILSTLHKTNNINYRINKKTIIIE